MRGGHYHMLSDTALPARWTAPEALRTKKFSPKSDVRTRILCSGLSLTVRVAVVQVWGLGVTMFEMLT